MRRKRKEVVKDAVFRIEPEKQICPIYDDVGIRTFEVAEAGKMGFRVVDDFVHEHIQ